MIDTGACGKHAEVQCHWQWALIRISEDGQAQEREKARLFRRLGVSILISKFVIVIPIEYAYDDVYGRSLDDEVAISPSTAGEHP